MDIGILGPLEVRAGEEHIDLGTPKARAVLAVLALRHDELVSADLLIESVWSADLPANPRAALQTNVSRVRRALASIDEGADRIETSGRGYRLRLQRGELDAGRFEALTTSGRQDLAAGRYESAAAALRRALRLWRGPVLGELGDLPFAVAGRTRLDELRLAATEDRIDADLMLGRHRELIPELETLATAHRVREGLWARLALALYRADRQAEALDRVRQLREHLADELGLDASPDVLALEHRLLAHDPGLEDAPLAAWTAPRPTAPRIQDRPPQVDQRTRPADPTPRPELSDLATTSGGAGNASATRLELPGVIERHRPRSLVGRSAVLDALLTQLLLHDPPDTASGMDGSSPEPPRSSSMRGIVITGEAGIGKTAVAAEAATHAHAAGATVLFGHCTPEPLLPAQPLIEILDQIVTGVESGLIESLGPRAGELARLVPDMATRLPGIAPPTDAPPGADRYLLARAIGDALAAAAVTRHLVVIIDDLQWADTATTELIGHLAATGELPTTTFVLTRRLGPDDDGASGLLATLARAGELTEVVLDGLAEDEIGTLVAAELAGRATRPISPWLGRSVHERTGGNPFFALELARHLAESDSADLSRDDGLPVGVVAVVERRLDELGAAARGALQAAALLGPEFELDLVTHACRHPDTANGVRAAVTAGLVHEVAGAPGHCAFAHSIVHAAVVRSVIPGEREALHARLAASMEQHRDPVPHAAVAHHWAKAGPPHLAPAVEHSRLAAELSLARRAYEDAAERCEIGLAALDAAGVSDHRRLDLLLTAADALESAGERHDARERAKEAYALARQLLDVDGLARAATIALPVMPDPAAAATLEDALELIPPAHPQRPRLLAALASMLADTDVERSDRLAAEARELVATRADVAALHQLLAFDTLVGHDVHPDQRIAAASEILDLAPSPWSGWAIDAHTFRGTAHLENADLRAAEADFAAHQRISSELRAPGPMAVDDQRRAMRALLAGRFDEAETHVHRAMLHVGDDPAWVSVYGAQLVAIRIDRGDHEEALALLDALGPPDSDRPLTRATRALMLASLGRHHEAAPLVREVTREHPRWRRDLLWSATTAMLADAVVAVGDRDAASVVRRSLEPVADRLVVFALAALCWGSVHRFLAPLAALLDDVDAAADHHERAIAMHERLGAVTFLVRDRLGLADVLRRRGHPGDDARAARLREEALASGRTLGLTHLINPARHVPTAG